MNRTQQIDLPKNVEVPEAFAATSQSQGQCLAHRRAAHRSDAPIPMGDGGSLTTSVPQSAGGTALA
jgi:hypothetical protein